MYGISGASGKHVKPYKSKTTNMYIYVLSLGRHNCLFCHICSSDLKIPLSVCNKSPARSLDTLKADYDKFTSCGSDLRKAKHYNNVIRPALFNIPLENVR